MVCSWGGREVAAQDFNVFAAGWMCLYRSRWERWDAERSMIFRAQVWEVLCRSDGNMKMWVLRESWS